MAKLGKTIKDVIRGDTRRVSCIFKEAGGATALDLSGGTVFFTVQTDDDPDDDSAELVFQLSADDSTPFTDPTEGTHTFTLSHDNTNITPGTYWYDAQFVDGVGNYLSAYRGKFIVQSDITRS